MLRSADYFKSLHAQLESEFTGPFYGSKYTPEIMGEQMEASVMKATWRGIPVIAVKVHIMMRSTKEDQSKSAKWNDVLVFFQNPKSCWEMYCEALEPHKKIVQIERLDELDVKKIQGLLQGSILVSHDKDNFVSVQKQD